MVDINGEICYLFAFIFYKTTRMGWLIESQFSKVPLYTLFVTTTPPVTSPLIHIKGKKTIKDSFKDRFTSCFNFCPTVLNENICYIMVGQINL